MVDGGSPLIRILLPPGAACPTFRCCWLWFAGAALLWWRVGRRTISIASDLAQMSGRRSRVVDAAGPKRQDRRLSVVALSTNAATRLLEPNRQGAEGNDRRPQAGKAKQ